MREQVRQDASGRDVQRRPEGGAILQCGHGPGAEVDPPAHPGGGDRVADVSFQVFGSVLLLLQQQLAGGCQRVAAGLGLLDHFPGAGQIAYLLVQLVRVAADPNQPVAECQFVTAFDPGAFGAFFADQETKVHARDRFVARIHQRRVVKVATVGKDAGPRKRAPLKFRTFRSGQQELQGFLDNRADGLAADADLTAFAFPFLPGRGLDLVALLFRVAQQVAATKFFQSVRDLAELAAPIETVVQALGHQSGVGGHRLLDQFEHRHGLGGSHQQAGGVTDALVQNAGHAVLDVRVEGRVLDLVDLVERDERADLQIGQVLVAEQLAQ